MSNPLPSTKLTSGREAQAKNRKSGLVYKGLAVLGVLAIFVAGVWLGRIYSAVGGPGISIIRRLRSPQATWPEPTPFFLSPMPTVGADVPSITPEELEEKLDGGDGVVVVDVRSEEAFDRRHIKGAISIPLRSIAVRYAEVPSDREIVIYCA